MVALTAIILFAGCMGGGGGRVLEEIPAPDPQGQANKDALCQEAIQDMEESFDAAIIKTKVVKLFFNEAIEACEGTSIDYVAPIATLFVAANSATIKACGGGDVNFVKTRIELALADSADLTFQQKFSFYTTNPILQCRSLESYEEESADNNNSTR